MKISPYSTTLYTNTQKKFQEPNNSKETSSNINEFNSNSILLKASYNMAFCGLFKEKPIDAKKVETPIKMTPMKEYLISDDAKFRLGGNYTISLTNPEINDAIKKLKPNEKIILGRDGFFLSGMNDYISRKHLEISKNRKGQLIAKDLNSLNGTTIEKQDHLEIKNSTIEQLVPHKKTIIPADAQLKLGSDLIIDMRNKNILNLLDENDEIEIGRSKECDIVIDNFHEYTSRKHLSLSKRNGQIFATDLGSKNGTYIIPKNKIKPFYNGAKNIELSQANIGDCYLLSTIYAMSRSDAGAKMLENMVNIDDNGNFIVSFANSYPITIKPDELDGQESFWDNKKKRSVSGDLGIKALERAYGRMIKKFKGYRTMFCDLDNGGFTDTALFKMTGLTSTKIFNSDKEKLYKTLSEIKENGLNSYIITCSTPSQGKYGKYMDPQKLFISKHAYAVSDINTDKHKITIVNPHNTKKKYTISWDDFSKMFSSMCYSRVPDVGEYPPHNYK